MLIRWWKLESGNWGGGKSELEIKNLRVTILKIESKSRGIFVTFYAL